MHERLALRLGCPFPNELFCAWNAVALYTPCPPHIAVLCAVAGRLVQWVQQGFPAYCDNNVPPPTWAEILRAAHPQVDPVRYPKSACGCEMDCMPQLNPTAVPHCKSLTLYCVTYCDEWTAIATLPQCATILQSQCSQTCLVALGYPLSSSPAQLSFPLHGQR